MATETVEEIVKDEKVNKDSDYPSKYNVIFINDDQTPMDFVIEILRIIFKHTEDNAKNLTMQIHNSGSAIAGTYTFEIAEQKTTEAVACARKQGFPLEIQVEKVV